ncbi:MAG: cation transporter [Cyclobacteriaceae bacterium]
MNSPTLQDRSDKQQRLFGAALWLGVFTVVYNLGEGIVATLFGYEDETFALFGFGVDSFIEMISGMGIVYMTWRIRRQPDSGRSDFERTAMRITGYCFYVLAGGLVITGLFNLYTGNAPQTTFWGVVISSISIVVMIVLIVGKIRIGRALQSDAILADANCTKVCIYMSIVLLASSGLYVWTGFVYADSLGTLGLAWFSVAEGRECFEKVKHGTHCHCH